MNQKDLEYAEYALRKLLQEAVKVLKEIAECDDLEKAKLLAEHGIFKITKE